METTLDEIADGIYRSATHVSEADMSFNQILVTGEDALLFHTGMRQLFPLTSEAVARVIEVSSANGVIPGIHTSSVAKAKYWIGAGMKMIGFCTDIKLIQQICKASVEELHKAISAT